MITVYKKADKIGAGIQNMIQGAKEDYIKMSPFLR